MSFLAETTTELQAVTSTVETNDVIRPRHSYLSSRFRNGRFKGLLVGDSIAEGSGASNVTFRMDQQLAGKLVNAYDGVKNDWAPVNYGVGSSTIANMIAYLSHKLDSNADEVAKGHAYSYPYWIFVMGRNDSVSVDIKEFSRLYRTAVRLGIRAGIDVICVTEPPKIDMATGNENDPSYPWFATEIRKIALDEGASLVDFHKHLYNLRADGQDLRTYSADGVHPNDAGYEIMADLIFKCMTGLSIPVTKKSSPLESPRLGYYVQSQFNYFNSSLASVIPVTGLTTLGTARSAQTGVNDVIEIQAGGYADFYIGGTTYESLTLTMLNKTGTGSARVESPAGYYTGTGYTANSAVTRETSHLVLAPGNLDYPITDYVRITAVGGPIYVLGLQVIGSILTARHDTVKGTEVGTWTDATSNGKTWRSSSTVGNTITVDWYGTDLFVEVERSDSRGVFGYKTDAKTLKTYDAYLNAPPTVRRVRVANKLALGWHKTTFSVETKNASALANVVNVRNLKVYSRSVDGKVIANLNDGITAYAPDGANYVRSQSGIPTFANSKITLSVPSVVETQI